jgi:hypothetical protein
VAAAPEDFYMAQHLSLRHHIQLLLVVEEQELPIETLKEQVGEILHLLGL